MCVSERASQDNAFYVTLSGKDIMKQPININLNKELDLK